MAYTSIKQALDEASLRTVMAQDSGGPTLATAVVVIACWMVLNSSLTLFNKWVLDSHGAAFHFPNLYTACHMAMTLAGSTLILRFLPDTGQVTWAQFRAHWSSLVLLSAIFSASLSTNNMSLMYLGVSVNQIVKSCVVLPTTLFASCSRGSGCRRGRAGSSS